MQESSSSQKNFLFLLVIRRVVFCANPSLSIEQFCDLKNRADISWPYVCCLSPTWEVFPYDHSMRMTLKLQSPYNYLYTTASMIAHFKLKSL